MTKYLTCKDIHNWNEAYPLGFSMTTRNTCMGISKECLKYCIFRNRGIYYLELPSIGQINFDSLYNSKAIWYHLLTPTPTIVYNSRKINQIIFLYPEDLRTTPRFNPLKHHVKRERNHPPRIPGASERFGGLMGVPGARPHRGIREESTKFSERIGETIGVVRTFIGNASGCTERLKVH